MRIRMELGEGAVLTFVAGNEAGQGKVQHGLSIFFNGNYVQNFVVLEHEVELLKSDSEIKCIDDLGHILIVGREKMRILNYMGGAMFTPDSDRYPEVHQMVESTCNVYTDVAYWSREQGRFSRAIKMAFENPEVETNLYTYLPEAEEVDVP